MCHKAPYIKNWYEHKPQKVAETENPTVLWDFSIRTDRAILANKPDIIIKDQKDKEHAN